VHASGPPEKVITTEHVEAVYGVRVAISAASGRPRITPLSRRNLQPKPVAPETDP